MSKLTLAALAAFAITTQGAMALECHGTEPFWGATLTNTNLNLDFTGDISDHPIERVSAAMGFTQDFVKVYSDNRGPVAVVTAMECDNSMSDHLFPMQILIFTGTSTLYGCCGEPIEQSK